MNSSFDEAKEEWPASGTVSWGRLARSESHQPAWFFPRTDMLVRICELSTLVEAIDQISR